MLIHGGCVQIVNKLNKIIFDVYEDGDRPAYPHPKFFEIVKERNCPIVLGLDTHDPAHFLDDKWVNNTLAIVKDLDLNILSEYDILESANRKKKKIFNY